MPVVCVSAVLLSAALLSVLRLSAVRQLCNVLSPHGYDNEPIDTGHIPVLRISAAYMLFAPLIPAAHLATLVTDAIVWAGVTFHIKDGRVSKMERKDGKGGWPVGEWYSVSREESLERSIQQLATFRER